MRIVLVFRVEMVGNLHTYVKSCATLLTVLNPLGNWYDVACDLKFCTICNIKSTPVFEMRGLCIGTSFDKHFSWTGNWDNKTEQYYFQGLSNSIIQWNDDQKEWRLMLYQNKTIYGTCNETQGLYPFGTFDWNFFNDTCQVGDQIQSIQFYKHAISFSGW